MRLITKKIGEAFENRQSLSIDNTRTDGESIWLHGNRIVRRDSFGKVEVSAGGYFPISKTTKERLSYFVKLYTKNRVTYLNEKEWDGDWHAI